MRSATGAVRIGTRGSRLARLQSDLVGLRLRQLKPSISVESRVIATAGDRDRDTPLPELGGKGVFTEELERALRVGLIDLAVHSLKDVPVEPAPGLVLAAIGLREDPRDVLVSRQGWTLATLPAGATVATCSTRRSAQLLASRPDLRLAPLRGNIDSRLAQAGSGRFDAIVLAAAGLHRLRLSSHITEYLEPGTMLPAPGQGALALQCRAEDTVLQAQLRELDDPRVRASTDAERAFLEGLGGGCAAPIAALARAEGARLRLAGLVASLDGSEVVRVEADGPVAEARNLGLALAAEARGRGAERLLS